MPAETSYGVGSAVTVDGGVAVTVTGVATLFAGSSSRRIVTMNPPTTIATVTATIPSRCNRDSRSGPGLDADDDADDDPIVIRVLVRPRDVRRSSR